MFDHKIRTPSISNSLWIGFFLFVFVGSLLNAIRFALPEVSEVPTRDKWFEIVSLTMHGLSTVFLSLTLNHQRRFRSSAEGVNVDDSETDPLLRRYDRIRNNITIVDILFVLLWVLYEVRSTLSPPFNFGSVFFEGVCVACCATCRAVDCASGALLLVSSSLSNFNRVFQWTFLGVFVVQRLPALVLTVLIAFFPKAREPDPSVGTVTELPYSTSEGPTRNAKVFAVLVFFVFFC